MKKKCKNLRFAQKILNNETPIKYVGNELTGDYLSDLVIVTNEAETLRGILKVFYRDESISDKHENVETYHAAHMSRMCSTNVKLNTFTKEIGDIVDDMNDKKNDGEYHLDEPITDVQKKWLEDKFNDEEVQNLWEFWIEFEREHLIDWIEEDYGKTDINLKNMGFYGRSGGHFCLCEEILLEYDSDPPDDGVPFILNEFVINDGNLDHDGLVDYIDDCYCAQDDILKNRKTVEEILEFVNKYVKGMDFNEELAYRIGGAMEDLDEFEEWIDDRD